MEIFDDPFIDALHDLLEKEGFLDPKFTFAQQINLRMLRQLRPVTYARRPTMPNQTDRSLLFFQQLARRDATRMDQEYTELVANVIALLESYCATHPLATVDFCMEVASGVQHRLAKAKQVGMAS